MLNKISNFLWRIAGVKTFIPALVIYVLYAGIVMQGGKQKIEELSGKKVEILDLQFSYTPEKAKNIIAAYTVAARNYTVQFNLVYDSIYPVIYTSLFLIMMAWVFKSLAVYGFRVKYIHLLPFLVMVADYSENYCIATMMQQYPDFSDRIAIIGSLFTSVKWGVLGIETFIIGAAIWLLTFYRLTKKKPVA